MTQPVREHLSFFHSNMNINSGGNKLMFYSFQWCGKFLIFFNRWRFIWWWTAELPHLENHQLVLYLLQYKVNWYLGTSYGQPRECWYRKNLLTFGKGRLMFRNVFLLISFILISKVTFSYRVFPNVLTIFSYTLPTQIYWQWTEE